MTDDNKSKASVEVRVFGPYDHNHPPPMDFETWAALGAELLECDLAAQLGILQRRQVEPDLWDACNAFWTTELAAQLQRSNLRLARRYGKVCANEMRRRRDAAPAPRAADTATGAAVDETAFLIALPDETALPFKRPARLDALAQAPELSAIPESERPVSTEETVLVPALKPKEDTLPFRKPDDPGKPR